MNRPAYPPLPATFIWISLAILIANRIYFHLFASPIPDEAYYWLWGQHPDWSYYDHPPLQAWLQGLSSWLFGVSRAALRAPTLLTTGLLIWSVLWWLKKGRAFGLQIDPKLALLILFSSPLYFIFTEMSFHDHLLIALLALAGMSAFTVFERLSNSGKIAPLPLYTTAVLLGLAGLTKYNAVLFALAIFALVALLPRLRPILKSPHLYLALVLALICIAPVAYWNATHGAASFQFHMGDRLQNARTFGRMGQNFIGFLVATAIALSPFLVMPLWRFCRGRAAIENANWRALSLVVLLVTALGCLILSYYISVLYYWGLVAFIPFLPFAAYYFTQRWQVIAHVVYGLIFATAFTFNYAVAPINALFSGYDSEFAILYGWPEISQKALAAQQANDADFLVTSDYRSGSLLAFWTGDIDVTVLSQRTSQFDLWQQDKTRKNQDAIIVTDQTFPLTPYLENKFASLKKLETIEVFKFGFFVNSYTIYSAKGYK